MQKERFNMTNVFVTGGTGFLAGWVIREFLENGYHVTTSVRAMNKSKKVTSMLEAENVPTANLNFAVCDLGSADGWEDAMCGCEYVIHTASPLGGDNMDDPSLIPIAVEGVEHVLQAAIRAGVKKVVMTSSEAANYPDKKDPNPKIDETFWTDENNIGDVRDLAISTCWPWSRMRRTDSALSQSPRR